MSNALLSARFQFFFLPLFLLLVFAACSDAPPARILVFSKTAGYRHDCIPTANAALRQICRANSIMMDTSEDASDFNEKNLRRYASVVFLCTTGDVLNPAQETDFERYIQAGGGYMGIHSATDTEYGWHWYGGLVGGYFNGHPAQQNATLHIENHEHPATRHLPGNEWKRWDEWYNFKDLNPDVTVLLSIDETSYSGGTNCSQATGNSLCHPMSWCHNYDGGRGFYTALGHTKESYADPLFMQHLLGGLQYAMGKKKRLNYTACRTPEQPDPTRFQKTVLADNLTEPMEFEMLPDGKILLIERRGAIKLFDPATGLLNIAYKLPVHAEHEDGLMGFALDPNYAKNHWIYLYYSPVGNEAVNNLSRFVFQGDTLDRASEKLILQVDVQRQECCHTGGCIEFDGDGYLYLSTGDNTNPFDSEGYAPIDERPGRSPWDARKSSANTNDLRGKILRIKPLDDGGYICPAGNLFVEKETLVAAGMPTLQAGGGAAALGRPEIYVMGCRNPFRISLDSRRHLLFWGEVGPDAGEPDSARGPQGHDEVNRARAAGFFGWPLFVGDNKPYREYHFATKKNGPHFDPLHPVNDSPNNTGRRDLPPAQPAFIWYPYGNSAEFPLVGNGGRNAMAGPVYYCDKYPAATRMPDYFDGKLITYDWMRNWMMTVTMDSLGNFSRMERFADSIRFSRPMDMFVDKNGSVWVLEYGTQWFSSNPDARISRIDYVRGNRPPIPGLQAQKTAGATPFAACFSLSKTKDYDSDRLTYDLDFGDETEHWVLEGGRPFAVANARTMASKNLKKNVLDSIAHVYATPGTYVVVLKVTDEAGNSKTAKTKINVGNEPPEVRWDLAGHNRSFYQPDEMLHYQIVVADAEDGSLSGGSIDPASVATTIDYLATGFDISSIAQGHQAAMKNAEYSRGKLLTDRSDCKTCHALDYKVNGPAFQDIAERYRKDDFAVRNLSTKIIKGGAGNWGQVVMSAHPQLSVEDAGEMVRWILSLGDAPKPKKTINPSGDYALTIPPPEKGKQRIPGTFILKAAYRDRGSRFQGPLESGQVLALRPAFLQAEQADSLSPGIRTYRPFDGDTVVLRDMKTGSFVLFKHTDLQGVQSVSVGIGSGDRRTRVAGGRLEMRLGSPDGLLVGSVPLPAANPSLRMEFSELKIDFAFWPSYALFYDVYLVAKNAVTASDPVVALDWVRFNL